MMARRKKTPTAVIVEELGRRRSEAAKRFAQALREDVDLYSNDKRAFADAFRDACALFEVTPEMMARNLGVDTSTVWRWKDGLSAPHPLARPAVIDRLAKRVEEQAALLLS